MNHAKIIIQSLLKTIDNIEARRNEFCYDPSKDFTRKRKVGFKSVIKSLLCFEGKSLNSELLNLFNFGKIKFSVSAFVQQRSKIIPEAFYELFRKFSDANTHIKLFHGYRLIAFDGSDINTPKNSDDTESLQHNQSTTYNIYHLNAFYDLLSQTYTDALVQKRNQYNEHKAFAEMAERFDDTHPAIFIADRGIESYNAMAHIQEIGQKFLIRVKDIGSCGIVSRFDLPDDEFDVCYDLQISRKKSHRKSCEYSSPFLVRLNHKAVFDYLSDSSEYTLHVRFVRIRIDENSFEVLATNLNPTDFPPAALSVLYHLRWGIETSFAKLKYTVGLSAFHSKKPEHIIQEIFIRLTFYNFCRLIAAGISIPKKERKHIYKLNFSVAVCICRAFLRGRCAPGCVETNIRHFLIPYRPGGSSPRTLRHIPPISFNYRIA